MGKIAEREGSDSPFLFDYSAWQEGCSGGEMLHIVISMFYYAQLRMQEEDTTWQWTIRGNVP
jgi:hypothetical protein